MVARTWEERELPILEAVVEADEADAPVPGLDALAEAVGLDEVEARRSARLSFLTATYRETM